MSQEWDQVVDYLVAGSGMAGMSAAITAKKNGLDTLIVESMEKWGGTTAISGGGLWVPDNPLMHRDGEQDSPERAFDYLKKTVGDLGAWSDDSRKWAFVNAIPAYITMLGEEGIPWRRALKYPDYYPDLPTGMVGRSIEPAPFNMRKLGKWGKLMREGGVPAPILNADMYLLTRGFSTPSGFLHGVKFTFRFLGLILTGKKPVGMGAALAGNLMYIVMKHDIPVWLNSPLRELVVENGRVVGAVIEKAGKVVRIRARRGVMLAAGGFAHNKEWRMKYQGVPGWSASPKGQLGQGIEAGEKAGGALAMMEDSWWGAAFAAANPKVDQYGFVLNERSDPYSMIVDQDGKRFMNESESYIDIGHDILNHNKKTGGKAIPAWLVTDHRHTTHFINTGLMMPGVRKSYLERGEMVESKTLEGLATKMGVDKETFFATIKRFNEFAKRGVDRDFERGRTVYDQYYGDPLVKPNPNLGSIEKGPFRAFKVYPGDLNTKGGLVTDEWGRVLREDNSVIDGLYSAGNNSASVMGHTYPGPGSTIAPAGVFGYLGALHAAQQAQNPGPDAE